MLTLTVRHKHGMRLRELHRGLMAAWRKARQGGVIQRVWSARVRASVRATEVTHGANGWHPHLHVLLCTDGFDEDERLKLWVRFRDCVRVALGDDCVPSYERGMVWSEKALDGDSADDAEAARYVAKFACETAGVAKTRSKGKSETPWAVAERAAAGDTRALFLWREYLGAMHGRRAIELDDRAAAAADDWQERQREDGDAKREVDDAERLEPTEVEVTRDELRSLRLFERKRPTIMHDVLVAAALHGASGVRDWVVVAQHETGTVPVPVVPRPIGWYARAG
jgi:hypothetical protein